MEEQSLQPIALTPPAQPSNIPTPPAHHIPKGVMIFFLIIFPPLALYFMYKDKKYHIWFAYVLMIFGIGSLGIIIFELVFVVPQLLPLYSSLNVNVSWSGLIIKYTVLIILCLVEIFISLKLYKKIKQNGNYIQFLKVSLVVLLLVYILEALGTITSLVEPIYTILSKIQ